MLRRLVPHLSGTSLVTDVGSTKARIVRDASAIGIGAQFVGSHPMAGDHRSGWSASRCGLFAGARVYLCPAHETTALAVERAEQLWTMLGARPLVMGASDHDAKLALTSHLPHVLSSALALALAQSGVMREDLGPGGRDVTRLAGSSPEVWTAIARDNAAALDAALAVTEREIASFRGALQRADAAELRDRFTAARTWFDVTVTP